MANGKAELTHGQLMKLWHAVVCEYGCGQVTPREAEKIVTDALAESKPLPRPVHRDAR